MKVWSHSGASFLGFFFLLCIIYASSNCVTAQFIVSIISFSFSCVSSLPLMMPLSIHIHYVCLCPVPMMMPKTTSETLKHKINPSLDLAEPQTVHVLLYTPGMTDFKSHIYCM